MANAALHNINVLIVDDERLIQRLVYDVVKKLGFHAVSVANSGRRAMEMVGRQKFDFIITDWRMQDLDGIDVINFVRKAEESTCPEAPIILLTGNTEAHYVMRARDAGVNEYVLKPFSAEKLAGRIRCIIERPRSFIESREYRGPDRRRLDKGVPKGNERRKRADKKSISAGGGGRR
jgi:DNA-binding response OmpR family regulator